MRTPGLDTDVLGEIASVVGDSDLMGGAPVQHWIIAQLLIIGGLIVLMAVAVWVMWWRK